MPELRGIRIVQVIVGGPRSTGLLLKVKALELRAGKVQKECACRVCVCV